MTNITTVSLTRAEYIAITPAADTLYLVSDGTVRTPYLGSTALTAEQLAGASVSSLLQLAQTSQQAAASSAADAASAIAGVNGLLSQVTAQAQQATTQATASTSGATTATAKATEATSAAATASTGASTATAKATEATTAASSATQSAASASADKDSCATYKSQSQAIYESMVELAVFEVGPAYNYGVTVSGGTYGFSWNDPTNTVTSSGATIAKWGKTRLLAKLGNFPANETDGTVLVDSTVFNQYSQSAFTWTPTVAGDYYFALFTMTTGGQWNVSEQCPRFTTDALTWQTIAMMTRAGTLMQYPGMELGAKVDIQVNSLYPALRYKLAHVDYMGDNLRVQDYMVDGNKTHNSIWIPDLLPCPAGSTAAASMAFDAQENTYGITPHTAFLDVYKYYKLSGTEYVELVKGTDYQLGDPIAEFGDTVFNKNHTDRISRGNNIWKESNMRIWLNSSGPVYWSAQNPFDVMSAATAYGVGWKTGFSADFLACLAKVKCKTARNTVAATSWGGGGGYDITEELFFLPSMKEVFGTNTNSIPEGAQFDYFRLVATTAAQRIQRGENGTAYYTWLRSPNSSSAYAEMYINTSGSSNYYYSSTSYAVLPACCVA